MVNEKIPQLGLIFCSLHKAVVPANAVVCTCRFWAERCVWIISIITRFLRNMLTKMNSQSSWESMDVPHHS